MDVKVRFRFNKLTGEVELFEVDQDSGLAMEEHNRTHDRLASELGALLDRHPRILETSAGGPDLGARSVPDEAGAEDEVVPDRRRQKDS